MQNIEKRNEKKRVVQKRRLGKIKKIMKFLMEEEIDDKSMKRKETNQ